MKITSRSADVQSPATHRPRIFEPTDLLIGAIALLLLILTPWEQLKGEFYDLTNYRYYFNTGYYDRHISSFPQLLLSEPAWPLIIKAINRLTGNYNEALYAASIVSVAAISATVVATSRRFWPIALLINPLFIDLCFSQVRTAVAASFAYLALLLIERDRSLIAALALLLLSFLIHTFMAAIIAVMLIYCSPSFTANTRRFRHITVGILVLALALSMTFLRSEMLTFIQDRRLAYNPYAGASFQLLVITTISLGLPLALRRNTEPTVFLYYLIFIISLLFAFFVAQLREMPRIYALGLPVAAIMTAKINSRGSKFSLALILMSINGLMFWQWAQ